jgi:hypothetical protein
MFTCSNMRAVRMFVILFVVNDAKRSFCTVYIFEMLLVVAQLTIMGQCAM